MKNTYIKYFTPKEAIQTLPLVKSIVRDILLLGEKILKIVRVMGDHAREDPEFQSLIAEIDLFAKELEDIGCFYKDWNFSVGLVDFPALIDNQEVFLCWRSDEETIGYYHGIDDGYQGRKLIPAEYFNRLQ